MAFTEIEAALGRAIEAAEALGLETNEARQVATTIAQRQGYPSDLYVLALVGGTGVGKSSLLNAIAGEEVSPAGPRRPTTSSPVAWLPADRRDQARPLIEWLGGAEVQARSDDGPSVAVVDLPDLDSVEPAHAARVDAVLPRVDAVLWVTDPEKYDDAILHDGYLRRWMPRLAHQAIVINKSDRLAAADGARVRDDLVARLDTEGLPQIPVLLASATHDPGPVVGWLTEAASAKQVVLARLRRSATAAVLALASKAGAAGQEEPEPLLSREVRAEAAGRSAAAVLDLVDLEGLRRQAVAATTAAARPVGGSPIAMARSLLDRGSGAEAAHADPEAHLRRWRERGSLDRAVAAVRAPLVAALAGLPADVRPAFAAPVDGTALSGRLARAVDAVVTGPAARAQVPVSRAWPIFGLGQLVATASLVAGVIWLVTLWVAGGQIPTPSVEVPFLGPVPTPAALIILGLLGWFVLGRLLRWHARRLGRRWADPLAREVRQAVSEAVAEAIDGPLDRPDQARRALWHARRDLEGEASADERAETRPHAATLPAP